MLYHWFELGHSAMRPARAAAGTYRLLLANPFNPLNHTMMGRSTLAALEVFERTTRRYDKPAFGIHGVRVEGVRTVVPVREEVVWERPFCRLLHFHRHFDEAHGGAGAENVAAGQPRVLLVAPMSGHFATLLRGTVETMLATHDVFITDWTDARQVPLSKGRFDLDDYIDHLMDMFRLFQGDVHVVAVCQPSVPVLAAVSLMEAAGDASVPKSMTLMGGPIDTRINPTEVNRVAEGRDIGWFRRNVITRVPWPNPGHGRRVYPGFLQLTGFMSMNMDRHVEAHRKLFMHLVRGDGDSAERHKAFYDEYLAVMDLAAEFYLQTVEQVFIRHDLPLGRMMHRGVRVEPAAIRRVGLMTVEGERDDITGLGQCRAAHDLCPNIADADRAHWEQAGVGHFGIFNGARFRREIAPRLQRFIAEQERRHSHDRARRGNGARRRGRLGGAVDRIRTLAR